MPRRALPGLHEMMAGMLDSDLELPATTGAVRAVLAGDLARRWTVADVAAGIAVSSRTLQGRLGNESTSFTEQVAQVRVEPAKRVTRAAM